MKNIDTIIYNYSLCKNEIFTCIHMYRPIAAVAKAKNEAYKEWYDKMGTEEGERLIYKVAKIKGQDHGETLGN